MPSRTHTSPSIYKLVLVLVSLLIPAIGSIIGLRIVIEWFEHRLDDFSCGAYDCLPSTPVEERSVLYALGQMSVSLPLLLMGVIMLAWCVHGTMRSHWLGPTGGEWQRVLIGIGTPLGFLGMITIIEPLIRLLGAFTP